MNTDTRIIILGQQNSYVSELIKILTALKSVNVEFVQAEGGEELHRKLLQTKGHNVILIIDAFYDVSNPIVKWLWNRVRLSERIIGKELAGIPVVVLGMNKQFLEAQEGKVFQDFSAHHQYLTKPLNLHMFLKTLSNLLPIDPSSLSVVKGDAPKSIVSALEHDIRAISKKFNYSGTDEDIKKRFSNVEVDLRNYERLQKNESKIRKARQEVLKLRREIAKRSVGI